MTLIRDLLKSGELAGILLLSVQGMDTEEGTIRLISDVIHTSLNIEMSVLMGANIAKDVAHEDFCECTIGREGGRVGGKEREIERESGREREVGKRRGVHVQCIRMLLPIVSVTCTLHHL